jgi:hypothetical protein
LTIRTKTANPVAMDTSPKSKVVATMLVLLAAASVAGGGCSSDADEKLGSVSQAYEWENWGSSGKRGAGCGFCDLGTAGPGCRNECATLRLNGQSCSTDPCDADGHCEDDNYCNPTTHTCTTGFAPLDSCLPTTNLCPWGYFCLSSTCARASTSICADAEHEGGQCDSNLDAPNCYPCGPGLQCVAGICKQVCNDVSECPCYRPNATYSCIKAEIT